MSEKCFNSETKHFFIVRTCTLLLKLLKHSKVHNEINYSQTRKQKNLKKSAFLNFNPTKVG